MNPWVPQNPITREDEPLIISNLLAQSTGITQPTGREQRDLEEYIAYVDILKKVNSLEKEI